MGWLALGSLTAFVVFDAIGLAHRTNPRGRAELGIAAALFFASLVGVPVLALGYANLLWRTTLALATLVELAVVFYLLARNQGCGPLIASVRKAARELATLPFEALREAFRARSVVFVGLLVSAALIVSSLVLTYLIEFCRWDDEIYHTPIVGWAIQHHGFAIVDAPLPGVGGTNGYPKLGEGLSLWFVVFTDKTLIELPATLYAAPLMLSVYALAARFGDRVCAMGLAVVLLLVPHSWRQFCSTYVDMEMGFFLLSATYYASRDELRIADLALCSTAMALAAATKTTWLVFVPPIALVAYTRLLRARSLSRRHGAIAVLAGILVVTVAGGLCVGRNWWRYKNPVWPVAYDVPQLGIHWQGIFTPQDYRGHDPPVVEGFEVPRGGMHDVMRHGYGLAVMWVAGPLGFVAMASWALGLGRDLLRRRIGESVRSVGGVVLLCLAWLTVGPNFGQPRYNLHVIGAFLVACAWLVRGTERTRLREGILGAMLVLSLVPLFWIGDANVTTLEEEKERLAHPLSNRSFADHPSFDLLERQKYDELKEGDEVVFSQGVAFPGLLWNFDFTNRVDYVEFRDADGFLAQLTELHPKWVCVGGKSVARGVLEHTGQWVLVGRTNPALDEVSFRRRAPS